MKTISVYRDIFLNNRVSWLSYLYNGKPYIDKTASLYWNIHQMFLTYHCTHVPDTRNGRHSGISAELYWVLVDSKSDPIVSWHIDNTWKKENQYLTHRLLIFKLILEVDGWGISCKIAHRWMSLTITREKSTLVQLMAWCLQAPSHNLSQCWPTSMSPYGIIRP